jgi:hypothetical protein
MNFRRLLGVLAVLAVAGCESFSNATMSVREKIGGREPPRVRTYAATPRETYDAVRTATAQMGYRFVRGGAAQGEFEAISAISRGETHASARQIAMKVDLHPTLDAKGTEVAIRLTEIIEADSSNRAGQGTEAPLRDTPQYDVFFRRVGQVLGVPPSEGR